MTLPIFDFTLGRTLDQSTVPRVLRSDLGDGFTYTQPRGLRSDLRTYSLQFRNRNLKQTEAIISFLKERGGYKKFRWTPPEPDSVPGVWIATSWRHTRSINGPLFTIQTTFQEQ